MSTKQTKGKSSSVFSLPTTPVMGDRLLNVSYVPKSGTEVLSKNHGRLQLTKSMGSGGEGNVFKTNNGLACKVYKEKCLTESRFRKIALMMSKPIKHHGICWPLFFIYNKNKEFVGYAMEVAGGEVLSGKIQADKTEFLKEFGHWTKENLVTLTLSILERMIYLHERNIIIGDINTNNTLFENESDVYFVDTDSYQIEGYPCPVKVDDFTAPEIQDKDLNTFLRTFDHENFAVATLLFMILHHGKQPYTIKDGGTPAENVKNGVFPYQLSQKTNSKVPDGDWIYYWDHLPLFVQDAFYDVFKNKNRKSSREWYQILERYKTELEAGRYSNEIFPDQYMQKQTTKTVICVLCKKFITSGDGYRLKGKKGKAMFLCRSCGQRINQKKGKIWIIGNIGNQQKPTNSKKGFLDLRLGNNLFDQFFN